jgi:DNA-directed RNA polymerase subunit RPC12/RpoP
MEFAVRQPGSDDARRTSAHRCPQCRVEALIMRRRHVSSPGWGEPVLTEYYDCDYCEAQYSYSPAQNRWKLLAS